MANSKVTKKALFSSFMALVICFSMLLGTTYAWFTDSVESGNNKIVAGNLDVEVYTEEGESIQDIKTLFNDVTLWEPGAVAYENLTVVNKGSLALKYLLSINYTNENTVNGNGLSDVLQVAVVPGGFSGTREEAKALPGFAKMANWSDNGYLTAKSETTYGIVIYWEPSAEDNKWNVNNGAEVSDYAQTGKNELHIDLGVALVATQKTEENDSFDKYYDGAAPWYGGIDLSWYDPAATTLSINSAEQLAGLAAIVNGTATNAMTRSNPVTIHDDFVGKTVVLASDINLNKIAWTPIGRTGATTTDFTYAFRGTFDGQNHTIYNLSVANEGWAGIFGVAYKALIKNLKVVGVELESNRMTGSIVGQLYGSLENCHVVDAKIVVEPNEKASGGYDNGDKVGGIVGWIGDNGNNHSLTNCSATDVTLKAYRDVGGIAGYVAWSTTIKNNKVSKIDITIDQATGYYGIKEANAGAIWGRNSVSSGVGVVADGNEEDAVKINKPQYIASVDDLKAALTNGGTYDLATDLALTETVTVPKGVEVVLNMNGKTIAGTMSGTGNQDLFLVKGNLAMNNGAVEMSVTQNQGWNAMAAIFDITDGGVVKLDGVNADNKGGTDMNFVAHLNNWGTATLNVTNSTLKATYIPVRVFNSGYDVNTVTIKNSVIDGGNHSFWVHNYIGDLDSAKHPDAAVIARLNFDIYDSSNTFKTGKSAPVRYGFGKALYFDETGKQVVTAPITVPVAPLEEDFLFPAGTNAVMYKDMVMSGDAQIVHAENAVLGLSNVTANVDHDLIVRKSGGAICISDCNFTLTDGAKLITVGEGGDAYQVFLVNVTVNGELLTDTNARQYLEGISWFGAYPEWPNT